MTTRYATLLMGGLIGVGWFILAFGPYVLDPTYLTWVMRGDGAQHVLGWLFFRHENWSWPLGAVPSLPYPVGTTVGYTDSIPWVATLAKAFSPILPADFQYIGAWLALCFFLQGWFGVKIVQELSPDPLIHMLAGVLFTLDPVLLWRIGHDSLCAHWLLLGLIWLHLRSYPKGRTPNQALAMALGFCLISAGVHPYLATMVLALAVALLCKLRWVDLNLSTGRMVVWAGLYGTVVLAVFAALGYIGSGISWGANGFGEYSADLLALVNPENFSRFLPASPVADGQYEGFGYVGSGVLLLSVVGIGIIWYNPAPLRNRSFRPWLPLGVCAALFAFFALSSRVTLAGKPILTLDHWYRPFIDITGPLRSSGRFIWPLHYLYIMATVAVWIAYFQSYRFILYAVLMAIIAVQILDFKGPLLGWHHHRDLRKQPFMFHMGDWKHAKGLYKHMILYPPQILGGTMAGCVMDGFDPDFYVPLAYQAYRLKLTFNSGYFSRIDEKKGRRYCQELHEQIRSGEFANDTIYIVHSRYWHLVSPHIDKIVCGRLNDYTTCVSSRRSDAFRDLLEQHKLE